MSENKTVEELAKRAFYLQRFATHIVNENVSLSIKRVGSKISSILGEFGEPQELTKAERDKIISMVTKEVGGTWLGMWQEVTEEFERLSVLDAEHVAAIYADTAAATLAVPAEATLISAAKNATMVLVKGKPKDGEVAPVDSAPWEHFTRTNKDDTVKLVTREIYNGWSGDEQLSNGQIVQRLRGTYNRRTKQYQGGLLQGKIKKDAERLVRTGVAHFSNAARDRMYKANESIAEARIYYAVMDNRVSKTCASLHLSEYKIGESYPSIPRHYNCRSVYLLKTKGGDTLGGTRPAIGSKDGTAEELASKPRYRGRKDSDVYDVQQVAADMTMDAFFKRQSRAWVESNLGKTRARLFLNGKMKLEEFTDKFGKPLNLEQLRATGDNDAKFRRAGL